MDHRFDLYERESHGSASNVVQKGTVEDILFWCHAQSCIDTVAILESCLKQLKDRLRMHMNVHPCDTKGKILYENRAGFCLILDPRKEE